MQSVNNAQQRINQLWLFVGLYAITFIVISFLIYHNTQLSSENENAAQELKEKNKAIGDLKKLSVLLEELSKTNNDPTKFYDISTKYTQENEEFKKNNFDPDILKISGLLYAFHTKINDNQGIVDKTVGEKEDKIRQLEDEKQALSSKISEMNIDNKNLNNLLKISQMIK